MEPATSLVPDPPLLPVDADHRGQRRQLCKAAAWRREDGQRLMKDLGGSTLLGPRTSTGGSPKGGPIVGTKVARNVIPCPSQGSGMDARGCHGRLLGGVLWSHLHVEKWSPWAASDLLADSVSDPGRGAATEAIKPLPHNTAHHALHLPSSSDRQNMRALFRVPWVGGRAAPPAAPADELPKEPCDP